MVITVASFKGGVGKSTTAVHMAAFLQQRAPTLLIDGDQNRSVLAWAAPRKLPFTVCDERQALLYVKRFEHVVVDTKARPEREELVALARGCHLLIIPCTPDPLSIKAMMLTVGLLKEIGMDRWRVLLTIVPPAPSRDAEDARELLMDNDIPVFNGQIRRLVAFQRAVLDGTTVEHSDRKNLGWSDYVKVGHEALALTAAVAGGTA